MKKQQPITTTTPVVDNNNKNSTTRSRQLRDNNKDRTFTESLSLSSISEDVPILLSFEAHSIGPKCPFSTTKLSSTTKTKEEESSSLENEDESKIQFDLRPGDCVWFQGSSGRGKTTLAMFIAGMTTGGSSSSNSNSNSSRGGIQQQQSSSLLLSGQQQFLQKQLHIDASIQWNESIPINERCGIVFQQTTLLDELTVAGNIYLALEQKKKMMIHKKSTHDTTNNNKTQEQRTSSESIITNKTTTIDHLTIEQQIKYYIELVGLNYHMDSYKRIGQLSGGMSRRVSLACQLAQSKHIIVLDEPFTGLDHETAILIAKELIQIRKTIQTTFILISHQYDIANILMDDKHFLQHKIEPTQQQQQQQKPSIGTYQPRNIIVQLHEPPNSKQQQHLDSKNPSVPVVVPLNLFGTRFWHRFLEYSIDYTIYSFPLILLAFTATGLAISMLSADAIQKLDVTPHVMGVINQEIPSLFKMMTGEEPSTFMLLGIRFKVTSLLNTTIPPLKNQLFSIGYTKLMFLEIGPLLTGLLLTGRIGGSYSGKVASMYASNQIALLQTFGIHSFDWSFKPAMCAAFLAAPFITSTGTYLALYLGGVVAKSYGITVSTSGNSKDGNDSGGGDDDYWSTVRSTVLPPLRIKSFSSISGGGRGGRGSMLLYYYHNFIEIITYPLIFHWCKAIVFMMITMITCEVCCCFANYYQYQYKQQNKISMKDIPIVITSAVVLSGLLIIFADWGFSQLWLLRQ